MSFDATRAAWAARRAGGLDGGPRLLVALAMAEMTYKPTGELQAGTRGLAALCGVSQPTVVATQRVLEAAGVIERAERGTGSRPSRWRWKLEPPPVSAPPGDNPDQRATSKAPATNGESAKPIWRATSKAVALNLESEYQDQVYTRVTRANGADLPAHLRDGVDPEVVPERVAALRDALSGPRGGGRSPSHTGAAPLRDLDAVEEAAASLAWSGLLQRPDIGAEYGDPEDGWQP